MSIFKNTLEELLTINNIHCAEDTADKCEVYFNLLIEANKTTNLTRITDEQEAAKMHFFGAIELLKYLELPEGAKVIDVGTGAGFPGIPIKIARPDLDMTLMDSAGKKTAFVKNAADTMGLDVTVLNKRAEEVPEMRGSFDFAVSRAVANLNMLTELCVPLLKTGGSLAAFKGERYSEELSEAKGAIKKLYCEISAIHKLDTGAIIVITKQKPTPDTYPRRFSKIKKTPL